MPPRRAAGPLAGGSPGPPAPPPFTSDKKGLDLKAVIVDYQPLVAALQRYKAAGHRFVDLAQRLNHIPSAATIGRYAAGKVEKPDLDHWYALHQAAPQFIPAPPITGLAPGQARPGQREASAEIMSVNSWRKVPVFDAGAGADRFWSDSGYPVGISDDYLELPQRETDDNTFGVRVHGRSMAPAIEEGDIAVVVPSRTLEHGKACFVTFVQDDCGERLVRRYFRYGGVVVLKPDNPAEGFEIELTAANEHLYKIFRVAAVHKLNP